MDTIPSGDECSRSGLRLFYIRTSGTEPKVALGSPKTVYPILTKDDTGQILLGRPREGCDVANDPAWKSRSCSPGRLVGSDEKQLVNPCVTYYTRFQFVS